MNYVVGSGPSGVAAASALLDRNEPVTLLDAGIQLEKPLQDELHLAQTQEPHDWNPQFIQTIKNSTAVDSKGIPEKRVYGSRFHYQDIDQVTAEPNPRIDLAASFAKGGLSNVWGAAVLPYREADLAGWPFPFADLAPHYEKVTRLLNLSAVHDELADLYPLYSDHPQALSMSRQAREFLADMNQNRDRLHQKKIYFGAARLAVQAQANAKKKGCVYCGLCLYGCPYSLIYNSTETLEKLQQNPLFQYRKNVRVERLIESQSGVHIMASSRLDGTVLSFDGSRVYLAAGVFNSTKILLESLRAYGQKLECQTNQHFILPLFRYKAVPQVDQEALHTLAQLYLEFKDGAAAQDDVHLQVYTYNDLYPLVFKNRLGPVYPFFKPLIQSLVLGRLLILQGYLHSDYSSRIGLSVENVGRRLRLRVHDNPKLKDKVNSVVQTFAQNRTLFQAHPISWMLKISQPGGGAHTGGTFPMKQKPGPFQSDRWGRPFGFNRTHLVDASVFPTIPANTITLTAMANAHRIASAAVGARLISK